MSVVVSLVVNKAAVSMECGYNLSKTAARNTSMSHPFLPSKFKLLPCKLRPITLILQINYFHWDTDPVFTKLRGLHVPISHGAIYTCEAETATYKAVIFLLKFTGIIIKNITDKQQFITHSSACYPTQMLWAELQLITLHSKAALLHSQKLPTWSHWCS